MSDLQQAVEAALNYIHSSQHMQLNPESVVTTVQQSAEYSAEEILSYMREVYGWNQTFTFDIANVPEPEPLYPKGYRPEKGDYRATSQPAQDDYVYSVWEYHPFIPATWTRPDDDPAQPWTYEPFHPEEWAEVKVTVSEDEYISSLGERRLIASDDRYNYDYWRL